MRVHHWLVLLAFWSLCFAVWRIEARMESLENDRQIFNWPSRADVSEMIRKEISDEGYDALIQQLQNIVLDHEKRIEQRKDSQ